MPMPKFYVHPSVKKKQWAFDAMAQSHFQMGQIHSRVGCLVVHGFLGTAANMRPVSDALAKQGYTVYVPLLRGHGTTLEEMNAATGQDWLQDVLAGYDRLKEAGCEQIFLIGLSMGAILSSLAAGQRDIAGLVLLSAPFRMKTYLHIAKSLRFFIPYAEFPPPKHDRLLPYEQLYNGCAVRKLKTLNDLCRQARKHLPAIHCPTLIVQSKADNKVRKDSMDLVLSRIGTKEVSHLWLEKARHSCTYGPESERVIESCLSFVKQYSSSHT